MAIWPFGRSTTKSTPANPARWFVDWVRGGQEAASGISVNAEAALRQSAAFAAVAVLAQDVAKLPLKLHRRAKDGQSITVVDDHPAARLLSGMVNPRQTSAEWRQQMQSHLATRGNAFSFVERNQRGAVVAIWPLHPSGVSVREAADYSLFYEARRRSNEKATIFPARDILHMRDMSDDGIMGLSRVSQMREALGRAIATERHGARLFKNSAQPGGILSHPGQIGPEARKNLAESWQERFTGEGAHRTAVLEEGVKYQQVGMSALDSQFIQQMEFSRAEIAAIWRVPPHKIGDLRRATFANIEHQSLEYVTDALLSWLALWEPRLDESLLTAKERETMFFRFNVAALLRGDISSRYRAYAVGRNWGWLSANDVREKEDMNPIPGGDEYMKPGNMMPLDADWSADSAQPSSTATDANQTGEGNQI